MNWRWWRTAPRYSYGDAVIAQYASLANIGRMAEQGRAEYNDALEELSSLLAEGNSMSVDHAVGYVQGRRGLSFEAATLLKDHFITRELDKFSQNG